MPISYFIVWLITILILLVVSVRLASRALSQQKHSYQELKASLLERGLLGTYTGPEYLRPQWEIRLDELEPWRNYKKILKHLEVHIKESSLTTSEKRHVEEIKKANLYYMPACVLPFIMLFSFLLLSE